MATTSKKKATKKIIKKNIEQGVAHIKASFNNTIVTIADLYGNVVVTLSAGALKFKGSQKSTGFAAQIVSDACAKRAMEHGMQSVYVEVKGPGMGRESAIRALKLAGLNIFSIKDVTPIPHNGCRPKKKRRV